MKKILIVITILTVFILTAALIGCSSKQPNTQSKASQPNSAKTPSKTFTADELKTYNGQNGSAAYVAVNGTVYDVTHARKWNNGQHVQGVTAGQDLTDAMGDSPHGTKVLNDIPIVGVLK